VNELFERGEIEPIKVFSNIVRLKQVIDTAEKAFRERINFDRADSWNGVTFTPKNGSEKLNLSEDQVYAGLEAKLKERGELVKIRKQRCTYRFNDLTELALNDFEFATEGVCSRIRSTTKLTFKNAKNRAEVF